MLVSDPNPFESESPYANGKQHAGYEAQADALAMLRSGLDQYLNRVGSAHQIRVDTSNAASCDRDRTVKNAETKLSEKLKAINNKEVDARAKLDEKNTGKLEALKVEHNARMRDVRAKYNNGVARAKKVREESVWMADTIHESSLKQAEKELKQNKELIEDHKKIIDDLAEQLLFELGQSKAQKVTQASELEPALMDSLTVDELSGLIQSGVDAFKELKEGGIRKLIRRRASVIDAGIVVNNLIIKAKIYSQQLAAQISNQHEIRLNEIDQARKSEVQKGDLLCREAVRALDVKAGEKARVEHEQYTAKSAEIQKRIDHDYAEVDTWTKTQIVSVQQKHTSVCETAIQECSELSEDASESYTAELVSSRAELLESKTMAIKFLSNIADRVEATNPDWVTVVESELSSNVPGVITLANGRLSLATRLNRLGDGIRNELSLPDVVETPVVWSVPGSHSLIIRHDNQGRNQALATMRNTILRILVSFPAGKVRFVLADPVGIGQSFAEFMSLSDQEPSPVGMRIWSDPQQIERQLSDITDHMQTVIQKYLRADYETIEDYNEAAGEISEPYRFIVIADLPEALSDIGAARLKSILESGPRCGVYAILSTAAGEKLPSSLSVDALESNAVVLEVCEERSTLKDSRFDEVEVSLYDEPADEIASKILQNVALAGSKAGTVEVPFDRLAPDSSQVWSQSCDNELVIPIGRLGAQKNQELRLGIGTRQHALIAGRTGSGKSTLLHVIISAAMLWHSPDELEMYLIDFKKGVEFKAYTGDQVPHVRAVAIESDREFGLSVLKRLDDELTSRGDLFRNIGAQNLASARAMAPEERLPRVLLLIDEFQEFFTEDDDVASEATLLLDRLVRQGRAFGVHVILGSQTLAGSYSLARSTLGQIGVRIALQCSEADSYLILGEDNNSARLLERPGEAIYNNAGGLIEGNSPFQTAWLSDAERDSSLAKMPKANAGHPATVVFEGNRPAEFDVSAEAFVNAYPSRDIPRVLLGDAVAIAPPTSAPLLKRSGSNLLIVGQQPEPSLGMLVSAAVTAGCTPGARLIIVDPTPEDDAIHGRIQEVFDASGLNVQVVTQKEADETVSQVLKIVQDRDEVAGDPIVLVLAGLHRLRSLRKSDDYSFSMDESKSSPDKDLNEVLRDGPAVGVWTLAWCDTLKNVERGMDRSTIREYGLRALMQMSASDSASLVDSSVASTLGANRALLADDVEGTLLKFRPVNMPDETCISRATRFLRS